MIGWHTSVSAAFKAARWHIAMMCVLQCQRKRGGLEGRRYRVCMWENTMRYNERETWWPEGRRYRVCMWENVMRYNERETWRPEGRRYRVCMWENVRRYNERKRGGHKAATTGVHVGKCYAVQRKGDVAARLCYFAAPKNSSSVWPDCHIRVAASTPT